MQTLSNWAMQLSIFRVRSVVNGSLLSNNPKRRLHSENKLKNKYSPKSRSSMYIISIFNVCNLG